MQNKIDNRRIMKNSAILYIRMLFLLVVGLYTGRLVLQLLGVEDYGIYNIAGGVITVVYNVTSSMTITSLRFIQVELGNGNEESQKKIFGNILFIHGLLGILIIVIGETVGLWFLLEKVVVPEERSVAAFWVYQFSVVSAAITIYNTPYNSLIISHERISTFAYIGVFDTTLKLIIIYIVSQSSYDKLIFYAFLLLCSQLLDRAIFYFYCKRNFAESICHISFDKKRAKEMISFAGWQSLNDFAYMMNTQGLNIILNLFFGPIINAARGVAVLVEGQVYSFYSSFQGAFIPQTVKLYSSGDMQSAKSLFVRNSKFSYFVLLIIALPVITEIDIFLNLWLVEVPVYSVSFIIMILLTQFVAVLQQPLYTIASANGHIQSYMIAGATILILVLPISYIFMMVHQNPLIPFVVLLVFQTFSLMIRIKITLPMIDTSIMEYLHDVLLPVLLVTAVSLVVPICLKSIVLPQLLSFLIVCSSAVVMVAASAYYLGCSPNERAFISNTTRQLINKVRVHHG